MKRRAWLPLLLLSASCVYFNAMYDAEVSYSKAVDSSREGRDTEARTRFDSVVAITGRIVRDHPESKHAAPAAILKARSELATQKWEAAASTAADVGRLTEDPRLLATAAGLEGSARRRLAALPDLQDDEERRAEEMDAADSLLSVALAEDLPGDVRASFLMERGQVRLARGEAEAAAIDLEDASGQSELNSEVRLDLARGLADVEQYEASVRLADGLIRQNTFVNLAPGERALLDTLVRRDPSRLAAAFGQQIEEGSLTDSRRMLLLNYRGRGLEAMGDTAAALEQYDGARTGQGRDAAEARYRWARLRIRAATSPEDIIATLQPLELSQGIVDPLAAGDAARLRSLVDEFTRLVDAYRSRGSTAAEAALRAAEIAGAELSSPRVSRGLYLRYLDIASTSPWRAKAIAGALLHHETPAGGWAGDDGAATDAELRAQLAALPADDPYRISIEDMPRNANVDSAYVAAERDLRRRLVEIRMLYDTTAVLVTPTDTAEAEADSAEPAPEPGGQEAEF
ncbi:MAG: hypothetical protein ACR2GQ_00265 [Gemmatimonadota bacterium]